MKSLNGQQSIPQDFKGNKCCAIYESICDWQWKEHSKGIQVDLVGFVIH